MNKRKLAEEEFIPGTMEREIAKNIVFRPVRSWHSNTYAGEGLYEVKGDGSGCLIAQGKYGNTIGLDVCMKPLSVTHRVYWNKKKPDKIISAFLSYPNGMGYYGSYFWEALGTREDDIERFDDEKEMERKIIRVLSKS